jgi:uncharacterized protein GlcG (DUF336 family)
MCRAQAGAWSNGCLLNPPGHSLWSAANGNPLDQKCLTAPTDNPPLHTVCGGGLPLYKGRTRIGGLGRSGTTRCAASSSGH